MAHRLRQLATAIARVDPLMRETVRMAAVARLRALRVRSATRLVDAALTVRVNGIRRLSTIVREDPTWPESVDGAALLDSMVDLLTRHVALPTPAAADAIALWLLHTFLMTVWHVSPILVATSPAPRCGKTRC